MRQSEFRSNFTMLGIILVGFFCFLVALILMAFFFCMFSCCCNNRRNTNADVELGLKKANTNTNLKRIEKSKEYKRISEPVIKDYKLYGQAEMARFSICCLNQSISMKIIIF